MAGSEENAAKIHTYEEAFQQIKEATGVSDTAEVVERSAVTVVLLSLNFLHHLELRFA